MYRKLYGAVDRRVPKNMKGTNMPTDEDIEHHRSLHRSPALQPREMVNHPSHYGGDVPHEIIKCLHAWGLESDALLWNAAKYIGRAGKKDDILQDLKKARFYLDRRIQALESEAEPEMAEPDPSGRAKCPAKKGGLEPCVKWVNHGAFHETAGGRTWAQ